MSSPRATDWSGYLMDDAVVQRAGGESRLARVSTYAGLAILGKPVGLHGWRSLTHPDEARDLLAWLRTDIWDFLSDPEMEDWCRGAMWLADELESLREENGHD